MRPPAGPWTGWRKRTRGEQSNSQSLNAIELVKCEPRWTRGPIAQLARAPLWHGGGRGFKSHWVHKIVISS